MRDKKPATTGAKFILFNNHKILSSVWHLSHAGRSSQWLISEANSFVLAHDNVILWRRTHGAVCNSIRISAFILFHLEALFIAMANVIRADGALKVSDLYERVAELIFSLPTLLQEFARKSAFACWNIFRKTFSSSREFAQSFFKLCRRGEVRIAKLEEILKYHHVASPQPCRSCDAHLFVIFMLQKIFKGK